MLAVTQLIGFGDARPAASGSFAASGASTSALTNYSFAGVSIGTADNARSLLIGTGRRFTSGTVSVSSLTVDGTAATQIGDVNAGATTAGATIFAIPWPSGTTATIAVNHSGACAMCGYAVWAAYDLESLSAADVQTDAPAGTWSKSLIVPGGGLVVGMAYPVGTALRTYTWAGITEDFDAGVSGFVSRTGAHDAYASTSNPTVSITPSGAMNYLPAVVASFR